MSRSSPAAAANATVHHTEGSDTTVGHCSICLLAWNSTGPHQVCCLRCGHVYGHSCILRWLERASRCPDCRARATKADVRLLYAEKVVGDLECTSVRQANKRLLQARQESAALQGKLTAGHRKRQIRFWSGMLSGAVATAASVIMYHRYNTFRNSYIADEPTVVDKPSIALQSKNIVKETRYQHRSNKPFRHLPHTQSPHDVTLKPETETPEKVGIEAFFTLFRSGDVVRTPVGVDTLFTSLHCFPVPAGTLLLLQETEIEAMSAADNVETCRSAPRSAPVQITPGRPGTASQTT